jgi:hypothetical protein
MGANQAWNTCDSPRSTFAHRFFSQARSQRASQIESVRRVNHVISTTYQSIDRSLSVSTLFSGFAERCTSSPCEKVDNLVIPAQVTLSPFRFRAELHHATKTMRESVKINGNDNSIIHADLLQFVAHPPKFLHERLPILEHEDFNP